MQFGGDFNSQRGGNHPDVKCSDTHFTIGTKLIAAQLGQKLHHILFLDPNPVPSHHAHAYLFSLKALEPCTGRPHCRTIARMEGLLTLLILCFVMATAYEESKQRV